MDDWQKMEYLDAHHKRMEVAADSFQLKDDGNERRLVFTGCAQQELAVLQERDDVVVGIIPEAGYEFALCKMQILEMTEQTWLALDFEPNPRLSRMVIHVDRLNLDELDAALRVLVGERPGFFHRRTRNRE